MSEDARFEDGAEHPLRLKAQDAGDVQVISAVLQDAVFPITEMRFQARQRRFAILMNRFRWEDAGNAQKRARPVERVQSLLTVEDVVKVATQGIDRQDKDTVLSLLSVTWEAGEDGTGRLVLTLAGDGGLALDVEALDVTVRDVTRPYRAVSGRTPDHGE